MQEHQNGESKAAPQDGVMHTHSNPVATIETSAGNIVVELFPSFAPISVGNFREYAEGGHYIETIFHRVISGFMIQGGGMTADMNQKPTKRPIKNEATNGLKNEVGTIAMARTSVVDSATSQFFINVKDNPFLDHKNDTPAGFGYCVFGKVIDGMDVVRQIEQVRTGNKGMHQDVPVDPVIIKNITIIG